MSLFTSTSDLRRIIPGIAQSYTWADLSPYVTLAEEKHIIDYISQEFYDELDEAYATTPSDEQSKAIAKLQYAIAYYTLLEALPHLGIQIGIAGIGIGTSQTTAQTTQWRENRLENKLASDAEEFLDRALAYLEKNKDEYPTWVASDAYSESKAIFITNANDLNTRIPIFGSRRAYYQLRPFMLEVQEESIQPTIGTALYQDLLTKLSEDGLNDDEKALIKLIQKPLAHLTARKAFNQLAISYEGRGFRVLSSNDGIIQKQAIPVKDLGGILSDFSNAADQGINALKKYLQDNATDWTLYKNSDAYIEDASTKPYEMPNNEGGLSFIV